jgi:flagellar FliL protein
VSAPEPKDAEAADANSDGGSATKPPRFGKRAKIIAAAVLLLVLVGGGAAFFLMPSAPADQEANAEAAAAPEAAGEGHGEAGETYVEVPGMVVNLRGADGAARFLKIRFTIVPVSAAKGNEIKGKLPLIIDAFQPFLRELRPEDLAGSAAVFRIKEEMLVRATGAMGPHVIKDILIQDLIQQ